jgi:hypothetical protein
MTGQIMRHTRSTLQQGRRQGRPSAQSSCMAAWQDHTWLHGGIEKDSLHGCT